MTDLEQMDQAELSLQEALDRMAAETPPMPESFRTGWRQTIRQEKEAGHEAQSKIQNPPARGRRFSWRRGLSIAAVVAFVLGGTLLSPDAASLLRGQERLAIPAVMTVSSEDAAEPETAEEAEEAGEESVLEEVEMEAAMEADSAAGSAYVTANKKTISLAGEAAPGASAMEEMKYAAEDAAEIEEDDGAMDMARAEVTAEELAETEEADQVAREPETENAGNRGLRIAGYSLIALAAILAAVLLITRKREEKA